MSYSSYFPLSVYLHILKANLLVPLCFSASFLCLFREWCQHVFGLGALVRQNNSFDSHLGFRGMGTTMARKWSADEIIINTKQLLEISKSQRRWLTTMKNPFCCMKFDHKISSQTLFDEKVEETSCWLKSWLFCPCMIQNPPIFFIEFVFASLWTMLSTKWKAAVYNTKHLSKWLAGTPEVSNRCRLMWF